MSELRPLGEDELAAAAIDEDDEELEDELIDDDDADLDGGSAATVLEYLAQSIVDDPAAVDIEVEDGRGGPTLRLRVAPDDMGKVIGRRGRVAQAIRTVVRAAGARDGDDVKVDIVD
ncbi:MAG: KH domain RNA binding protein YlqC [uncultured Acidimicrobiales bacterium]|uniref:RNA-binding protein KhpA n=1 Tax=uncultured Acidimicrobiales bacterium TaxID=310071 RepID=A0A6J4HLL6_9ACTN|nr:MAG: KH domain RNA binding protein YlqC [uncultured Acidimicrobiales bacterium]